MNNKKTSNPVRLIAFFLAATVLLCTFGFTVDGWHIKTKNDPIISTQEKVDRPTKEEEKQEPDIIPEKPDIYIPAYTNPLTGLECDENIANSKPFGIVMDGSNNLYGISNSDIIVEIPVENHDTRFISFIHTTNEVKKLGSISPSRGYISNLIKFFGANAIFNGTDDKISYDCCNLLGRVIDLSKKKEYSYIEHEGLVYTNKDLIDLAIDSSSFSNEGNEELILPYAFLDYESKLDASDSIANNISIFYSDRNLTQFVFNSETNKYSIKKNDLDLCDASNGISQEFSNCFILYSDSVTYDTSDYSQIIVQTTGSGSGFYFTEGMVYEMRWSATTAGVMTFYSTAGEKLTVNRGSCYIAYVKSSEKNSTIWS